VTLLEKLVENVSVRMVGIYSFVQTKAADYVAIIELFIAQIMLSYLAILFFRQNLALCKDSVWSLVLVRM